MNTAYYQLVMYRVVNWYLQLGFKSEETDQFVLYIQPQLNILITHTDRQVTDNTWTTTNLISRDFMILLFDSIAQVLYLFVAFGHLQLFFYSYKYLVSSLVKINWFKSPRFVNSLIIQGQQGNNSIFDWGTVQKKAKK